MKLLAKLKRIARLAFRKDKGDFKSGSKENNPLGVDCADVGVGIGVPLFGSWWLHENIETVASLLVIACSPLIYLILYHITLFWCKILG